MKRLLITTALCSAGLGATQPAFAQEPQAGAEDAGRTEIIVTAQRREQSAQDVGIALSVVSPELLAKRGITNVNQLEQLVPNLQIEPAFGSGAAQFRIRGVGFQDYATNNSPTVGVYVNEVAYPAPVMTQGLIFDIERVEVLRGPQGTLYGRNTTAGAINFITAKPTDELAVGGSAEYGRFDAWKAQGYVSGPLTDWAKIRVSAATEQGGAFQHNRVDGRSLGDADKLAGRALLELDQGQGVNVLIDVHAGRDHSENTGLSLLTPMTTAGGVAYPADSRRETGWSISPRLAADADLPGDKPGRRNWTWGTSANVKFDVSDSVLLTSITSYDYMRRREYGDYDATSSIEADVFFGSIVKVFSQEARLSSKGDGPLNWVAGVYYSKQDLTEQYYSDFLDIFATYARVNYEQDVRSIAGFAQVELAVTDKLKAIAGIRYEDEKRKLNGFGSAFGGAQALPPTNVSTSMKPWSGKIGLEYKALPELLLYTSASKGVKSGGFTTYNTGNRSAIQPFKPEKLYAFEAGFKTDFDHAIQINGSAFWYEYRDQQVLDAACGANGYVGRFTNAKKSRIWGIELEANLRPVSGLTISPYASYTRGKYKDFQSVTACGPAPDYDSILSDRSGDRIPFLSTTAGANISYEIPAGEYLVTPSASISYRSKAITWLDLLRPGVGFAVPSYTLVDGDLALSPASRKWTVALWGRNLFDKDYDLTRNFFTSSNVYQAGRPRTYGVRASFNF
ncbi:MAG: TonB-dependent receptor [Sphingobium sp.]|nr:MAG: TonB-dependent receptor [Sphingobium sp.]